MSPHSLSSLLLLLLAPAAQAWDPVPTVDDPLIRMPGTQPDDGVTLESPNRCLSCHSDYDPNVAPGNRWQGSMMSQAARDPLFWAAMTVAAQDSVWAVGTPNAADLCLRCHMPEGWGLVAGTVPQIAGQHRSVLIKQLADIRAGNRDAVPMLSYASAKAIGAAELVAHIKGEIPLDKARDAAIVATRQYAKRQRSWFRARMANWRQVAA